MSHKSVVAVCGAFSSGVLHGVREVGAWRAALAMAAGLTWGLADVARAQNLPMDPALVTGTLDNGMRYIVRQHANPPGRGAMWIHLDTGSLNETEAQRGIAHYLEHMAFNGSENFPPGAVVPFFQSLGMTFGRDQNAFTSFDQTTYQLALPDAKPETLTKGFTFFSDVLTKLSLLPNEIDEERQIIQEERRRSLSGRQRTQYHVIENLAPGSLVGRRITIGTEGTINSVQRDDFLDYYGKYYTASNATMIVVADADPAGVVEQIKQQFGSAAKQPRPMRQDIGVRPYASSFAIVASDPEVRSEDIRITRLEPARPPVTTVELLRAELVARISTGALNRRLENKVSKGGTSYLSASASIGNQFGAIHTAEIGARAASGKWKEALNEVALELQRARAFGFTQREVDDVKKELISSAERSVETEPTAPAQMILGRINSDIASGEPTLSASQRLDLLKTLLPSITPDEVGKRFAQEFDPSAVSFTAVLPSGANVPTEAELLSLGKQALDVKPTQEAEEARATTLMAKLPEAGTVADSTEHAASGVTSAWLSNNVRVHHRFMDYRKNQVSVSISLVGGELLETAETRGLTQAAQIGWARPATRTLSSSDIRELMTGKKVNVRGGGGGGGRGGRGGGGGGGGPDSISLNVSGSPEELEVGMQLAHLMLTEPKIETASFEQFRAFAKQMLQESDKNPMMFGSRLAAAAPYPASEARTQPLTIEQLESITPDAAQAWLDKLIATSPIEVVIIGDISKDRAMELAAKYLGSLPNRERVSPQTYASLRRIQRPEGPRVIERVIETPTQQAYVLSGFYGADEQNLADVRALSLAARVLSTRMVKEVREESQLVYSIGAGSRAASTYPGFGVFSAAAPTEPAKADPLVEKLASMYETFAKNGPTEEELGVAKKQIATTLDEQMKEPGFWGGRLDQITFRNANLDDTMNEPKSYQAITPEQVRDTFAKYYSAKNAIVVKVKPAAGAAESGSETKPSGQ